MNEKIKWNVPADDYEFQIYPRHYAATFYCDLLSEWVEQ